MLNEFLSFSFLRLGIFIVGGRDHLGPCTILYGINDDLTNN